MIIEFIVLFILLVLSGFFSGTETAYMALTHIQIKKLEEKDKKKASIVKELKEKSHKLITTILICNNLVNISASALATYLTIVLFSSNFIGATTGILTLVILIFGEVTPKKIALDNNGFICLHTARFLTYVMMILTPIVWIIDKLSYKIICIFCKDEKKIKKITEEDIISAVEIGEEIGELEPHEKRMIHNIFRFNDIEVEDIMVHRTDMFSLEENTKVKDAIKLLSQHGYSRIPVYKNHQDKITGVLLLKKMIPYINSKKINTKIKELMIKPIFVPETRKIDDMLKDFKREKTHIAIVVDEKGGVSGIVTIEDVLEEIVGEIYDETYKVHKKINRLNKNTYILDGDVEIETINKRLKLKLSTEENFEVLSGYILRKTGEMPKVGKEIRLNKGKFIIESVQNNRIELVKFIKK